jgi:transposase
MSGRKAQKRRKPRKSSKQKPRRLEVKLEELEAILERAQSSALTTQDHKILKATIESFAWLTAELQKKNVSLARLRQLFGLSTSEKTRNVLGKEGQEPDEAKGTQGEDAKQGDAAKKKKPKGHGRKGADAYKSAKRIRTPHPSLGSGAPCPDCEKGKVYALPKPSVIVRVSATAPIQATVYEQEGFRCNLCGKVFWAAPPAGIGKNKYDEASASMIALLKYGSGMPFNRLARLEGSLGIPLSASTQWEIVAPVAMDLKPAWAEMIRQAAQGQVVYNDDTAMKILEHIKENAQLDASKDRTGTFTSGIVSTNESRRIALFFTGRKHAGENLADVLGKRAEELSAPLQMCDGLDRNIPKECETVPANCLTHGRRKFVEIAESFPEECTYVLKILAQVYKNDDTARGEDMSPEQRLQFHQANSTEPMKELEQWMKEQIEGMKTEPNSTLGQAIRYMRKRWERLTLFLSEPGAPLDNNICERALKKAILHRKNSLFYKTTNGALVADIFMTLIYTAELCEANPFDFLTELQKHRDAVRCRPQDWMPWNYQTTVAALPEAASVPSSS